MAKKSRRKKKKRLIEIKTNRNGWTVVELLAMNGHRLTIKMPDGQIIKRDAIRVRWDRVSTVEGSQKSLRPLKELKNRKGRRKRAKRIENIKRVRKRSFRSVKKVI